MFPIPLILFWAGALNFIKCKTVTIFVFMLWIPGFFKNYVRIFFIHCLHLTCLYVHFAICCYYYIPYSSKGWCFHFLRKNALSKAKQPTPELKLKRSKSWKKKPNDERKPSKKDVLLSNGMSSRDNETLISDCDIELDDVKVEVRKGR